MSRTVISYAVIGMKIEFPLYNSKTVKTFDHDFSEHYKFHPETGKELWEEKFTEIEGYDECGKDLHPTYLGYRIASDAGADDDNDRLQILALEISESKQYGKPNIFNKLPNNKKIDEFRQKLQEAGVWNEQLFGLWSVLYYS